MVETQEKAKQTLIALGFPPFLDETGQEAFLRCAKEGVLTAIRAYVAIGMPLEIHEKYSKETPLIRAVEGKHSAVIKFLLEAGADLEGRDNPGDTALLTAVNWQHPKIVTLLLEAGADPHAVSNGGWTPLSSAVDKENREIIRILLEAGINVNQETNGLSALDFAPTTNDLTITQMLIKAGANVNKPTNSNGQTYLMKAAEQGNHKLLDLYLKAGAAINATSRNGWTAWMIATEKGFTELAEHLRKRGASTNGLDRISFLQAASKGLMEEVQRGLDEGIAIDTLSMKGDTALHLACAENHPAVVTLLLKAGADIEAKNIAQATPLSRAVTAGHLEVVKILLAAGANPDTGTPLVTACWNENREIVQTLLAGGANVNITTVERNNTALLWASFKGTSETARLLIEAGANLNIQDKDGVTALSCAAFRGHVDLVELLVQAGANVNIANQELETPLHRAISQKSPQMVELLLAGGADPTLRSTWGRTSLDEAYLWGEQCLDPLRAFLTWRTYHQLVNERASLLKEEPEQFYQQLARTQNDLSLLEWVRANELEIVRGLLQAGMSPNTHSEDRATALIAAVESDSLSMVKLLLEFSSDVNARSWWGGFALMSAAGKGNREIVAALLEAGANVHLQNDYYTALHSAAEQGHIAIMEQLYQAGAAINPNSFGWSPLMRASLRGLPSAVEWLLKRGANVNVRDYWFGNALTIAAEQKSNEVVSLLLTKEIDLDVPTNLHGQEGYTPLMYAVQAGLTTMVAELLRKGANPRLRNGKGQTVFDLASYRPAIADLLRSQNTEQAELPIHEIPPLKQHAPHPPLHRAVLTNNVAEVQRLLEAGGDVNAPNKRGDTALHFSAARGQDEIVQILLRAGASIHAENRVGETPWVLAATNQHKAVEQLLDRAGATIDANKMAEHMGRRMKTNDAVKLGDIAQVKELVESDEIDIDALTMGDVTALITATIQNDRAMTRALLALGADVNAANSEGKTPLFFARYSSFEEIASILIEAGATWPARYSVTCPGCGKQSEIFFLPQENGFAYCRECYQ